MEQLEHMVTPQEAGLRADKLLGTLCPELSRSAVQKSIESGGLTCGAQALSKNTKVKSGMVLQFILPQTESLLPTAQAIPLDILYEDDDLLVVNKPKGMVVHPAPGHTEATLVHALLHHCKGKLSTLNGPERAGIVHRIDKDTSGLLMVAKTEAAHENLAQQIAEHSFHREYRGVIVGHLKTPQGTIEAPIGRNPKDRKKMAVTTEHSKPAKTDYETLERYVGYSLMRFTLYTGRTHQIRVHLAHLGHPLAGDFVYGKPKSKAEQALLGQCLHAAKLGFVHPRTHTYMEFEAPLPTYFQDFQHTLKIE